jgi:hypothetical protein
LGPSEEEINDFEIEFVLAGKRITDALYLGSIRNATIVDTTSAIIPIRVRPTFHLKRKATRFSFSGYFLGLSIFTMLSRHPKL